MSIIAVCILWYILVGRNKPETYNKVRSKLWVVVVVFAALTFFSAVPLLSIIMGIFSPFLIFVFVVLALVRGNGRKQGASTSVGGQHFHTAEDKFTKAVPKRTRIVSKFNKEYGLRLTNDQIKIIVDASYISPMWENEIRAMDKEYNTIYEWFAMDKAHFDTDTAWLRGYLYSFNVQEVSSDFAAQKEIVLNACNQIFGSMDFKKYSTRKDMLWELNNRYLTRFDEITFMIAYRFLEREGYRYDIGTNHVVKNEDETDRLKAKYEG